MFLLAPAVGRAQKLGIVACSKQDGFIDLYSSVTTLEIRATLKCGQQVQVLDRFDNFIHVRTEKGEDGFVDANSLTFVKTPPAAKASAARGKKQPSAAALASSRATPPPAPAPPREIILPHQTAVHLKLDQTLSSATAHVGEGVTYEVTENVIVGGLTVIAKGAPARAANRLGSWFPTVIGGKRVMCFKSELHMSQDGLKLPVAKLWQQLIAEVQPKLVITTGTAGGIGAGIELGDVVIARSVRFDCIRKFKTQPFHASSYVCSVPNTASLPLAAQLFSTNAAHLPPASRPAAIFIAPTAAVPAPEVVTTDFFAFDDTSNTFSLQGMGAAVEMGDAVLGMVIEQLGASAPSWLAVRNASDPEIDSAGLTEKEAAAKAAQIYERFGYWTTIPSAITCWALILDN